MHTLSVQRVPPFWACRKSSSSPTSSSAPSSSTVISSWWSTSSLSLLFRNTRIYTRSLGARFLFFDFIFIGFIFTLPKETWFFSGQERGILYSSSWISSVRMQPVHRYHHHHLTVARNSKPGYTLPWLIINGIGIIFGALALFGGSASLLFFDIIQHVLPFICYIDIFDLRMLVWRFPQHPGYSPHQLLLGCHQVIQVFCPCANAPWNDADNWTCATNL